MNKLQEKLIPALLRVIGVVLLSVGLVGVYYGPLEIWVFYLFSEGGQFYYEGFGVGSFWFAALVVQNLGYYVVAALCVPAGIGHIRLRRWALTLTRLILWFWLGFGLLGFGNFLVLIPSMFKDGAGGEQLPIQLTVVGGVLFVVLIVLPGLGMWMYYGQRVTAVFADHDPDEYWTERYPFSLLAVLALYAIVIAALHVAIFFQSVFPVFGELMHGREAVYIVAFCVLIMGVLIYGTVKLQKWAWWGGMIVLSYFVISAALSFTRYGFYDIVLMMDLPAYEMEFLDKTAVIHEFRLAGLLTPPLVAALVLLIVSKGHFDGGKESTQSVKD